MTQASTGAEPQPAASAEALAPQIPSHTLALLFAIALIDSAGVGIIVPVLPALIGELSHEGLASAARWGGWLIAAYALMQFLCAPVLGALSDRFGRRPVLLLSMLGFGLDYLFLALASSLWMLFVGRAIAGITGACGTTVMAYVADISRPEHKSRNFGLMFAAFGLGMVVGPLTGGLLGAFGTRWPFMAAAALCLLNAAMGWWLLAESLPATRRRALAWRRMNPVGTLWGLARLPRVSGLLGVLALVFLAFQAPLVAWPFYGIAKFGWSEAMIGVSLACFGLAMALVQALVIRWTAPRLGDERSLYIGIGLHALGLLLFSLAPATSWMLLAIVPYCLGGIGGPSVQSLLSARVPADRQGELQGGITSIMSFQSVIGPVLASTLFAWGIAPGGPRFPGLPFLAGAVLMALATLLGYAALRKR